jgi:hypothetical protein
MTDTSYLSEEVRRLEDTLRSGANYEYQGSRGVEGETDVGVFNTAVWELTDFLCDRTGKYRAIAEKMGKAADDIVLVVTGAVLAQVGLTAAAVVSLVRELLEVLTRIGVAVTCRFLPREAPG